MDIVNDNTLKSFSTKELEEELERRRKMRAIPVMDSAPDWARLMGMVKMMVSQAVASHSGPWWHEDNKQYIFEEVMTTLYGENFFKDWFNKVFK